jgi:hypothetical protein
MKASDVVVGGEYVARINGQDCVVKINEQTTSLGRIAWNATNQFTGRKVLIKSAMKLRRRVDVAPVSPNATATALAACQKTPVLGGAKAREAVEAALPPTEVPELRLSDRGANAGMVAACTVPQPEPAPTMGLLERAYQRSRELAEKASEAPHVIVKALAGTGKTTTIVCGLQDLYDIQPHVFVETHYVHDEVIMETRRIIPSDQQRAVWDAMKLGPRPRSVCFAAFGEAIARVLQTRVPKGVTATTLHKLGLKVLYATYPSLGKRGDAVDEGSITRYRTHHIIKELLGEAAEQDMRRTRPVVGVAVERLVELVKQNLVPLDDEDDHDRHECYRLLQDLALHYDVVLEATNGKDHTQEIFDLTIRVIHESLSVKDEIDFNDMVWLPVMHRLNVPKFDLLLVDEAQDLNRSQQALARMAGHRLVLVGDDRQAIFGFAGADSESMPRMSQELGKTKQGCVELALTVTRRCGKAIVKEANKVVPEFEAHPDNPEGLVRRLRFNGDEEWGWTSTRSGAIGPPFRVNWREQVSPGDFVLCRTNAPLVSECLRFLIQNRRARIQGRDIGTGLITLVRSMEANSIPDLLAKLQAWGHGEVAKERAKRNPSETRITSILDKVTCIHHLATAGTDPNLTSTDVVGAVAPYTIPWLITRIEALFQDDNTGRGYIILSSIHKAKGLEADRVWFIQPKGGKCPHPNAESEWEQEGELNLWYVAVSRAKLELYHVIE